MSLIQQISLPIAGTDGSWKQKSVLRVYGTNAVSKDGRLMYVYSKGTTVNYIYISSDYGKTWNVNETTYFISKILTSQNGDRLVAIASNGAASNPIISVIISFDYGQTWNLTSFPSTNIAGSIVRDICVSSDCGTIYASFNTGIYKSIDFGSSYTTITRTFSRLGVACNSVGNIVYSGNSISVNSGTDWVTLSVKLSRIRCSQNGNFVIGSGLLNSDVGAVDNKLFYSRDRGNTWKLLITTSQYDSGECLAVSDDGRSVFYRTYEYGGSGLYTLRKSEDFAETFVPVPEVGPSAGVWLAYSFDCSYMVLCRDDINNSNYIFVYNDE